MRKIWYLYLLIFIISCNNDDNISETPSISHESIVFKKSPNNITQDSLILTINFIDGNGDLGLSNDENNYPYHPYNAIIDQNFNWVTYGSMDVSPPLYVYEPNGMYYPFSNEDNRPSFNCEDYIIDTITSSTRGKHTLMIRNLFYKECMSKFWEYCKPALCNYFKVHCYWN